MLFTPFRLISASSAFFFHPEMPLGCLGHGFMLDQSPYDTPVGEAAAEQKYTDDNQNNVSGFHKTYPP